MARRVIILRGDPVINEDEVATEAITPGHLLALTPTGVELNSADGAPVAASFALERDEVGRDIDTPYAVGDVVKAATFAPGQRVYAFLASGQNVAKGDYLTGSATADGALDETADPAEAVGRALEATDNSGGANPRVRCEVV